MTKKSRQKLKYLESEKSFWGKIKASSPGALAENKYAIAVLNNGKTVPKFLTRLLSKKWWQATQSMGWAQKVFGIARRLLFYFVKGKAVSSNERKGIGRGAVWEANKRIRATERKEQKKRNWKRKNKN